MQDTRIYNIPFLKPQKNISDMDGSVRDLALGKIEYLIHRKIEMHSHTEHKFYGIYRANYISGAVKYRKSKSKEPERKDWVCEVVKGDNGLLKALFHNGAQNAELENFLRGHGIIF